MKVQSLLFAVSLALTVSCANTQKSQVKRFGASEAAQSQNDSMTNVALTAETVRPLLIGATVPNITLTRVDGKDFVLGTELQLKPTVLIFYRGGWCPYCNVQLQDLRKIESRLIRMGYQLIVVSPDKPSELKNSITKNKLGYQLVSDSKAELMRAMGVAFKVDGATFEKYKGYGIDLEAASEQTHHFLPVPSVFLLDKTGKITFEYVNPDYRVRLPAEVILAAAKAEFKALKPAAK